MTLERKQDNITISSAAKSLIKIRRGNRDVVSLNYKETFILLELLQGTLEDAYKRDLLDSARKPIEKKSQQVRPYQVKQNLGYTVYADILLKEEAK